MPPGVRPVTASRGVEVAAAPFDRLGLAQWARRPNSSPGGEKMLVLGRKLGERIVIGSDVVVTVVSVGSDKVKLGVTAPANVPVHREEVRQRIEAERELLLTVRRAAGCS